MGFELATETPPERRTPPIALGKIQVPAQVARARIASAWIEVTINCSESLKRSGQRPEAVA